MFGLVRCIIGAVIFGISFLIIRKSRSLYKKKLYIGSGVVSLGLAIVLAFVPVENPFITFSSPEEVYDYVDLGMSDVTLVVPGKETDLVIAGDGGIYEYLIVPKTEDGWKVGLNGDMRVIADYYGKKVGIRVYQFKDTNDCYVHIVDTTNRGKVTDCFGSEFYELKDNEKFFGTNLYAYLPEPDPLYWVTVNGVTICPFEESDLDI